MLTPTLHNPIPMNTRVIVPADYFTKCLPGTVVGISFMHANFSYIVLLDEPIQTEYGEQKAICAFGTHLKAEDGTNWRLELKTS